MIDLDPTSPERHERWWPLAPGEWWSGNYAASRRPSGHHDWSPRDLVQVLISPNTRTWSKSRSHRGKTHEHLVSLDPPYFYRVTFWGSDDTFLEPRDPKGLTAAQVTEFLRALPNPLTADWLRQHGYTYG